MRTLKATRLFVHVAQLHYCKKTAPLGVSVNLALTIRFLCQKGQGRDTFEAENHLILATLTNF